MYSNTIQQPRHIHVFTSSEVDIVDSVPCKVKPKTKKLLFAVSPLNIQVYVVATEAGLVGIRIVSREQLVYLSVDRSFSLLYLSEVFPLQ